MTQVTLRSLMLLYILLFHFFFIGLYRKEASLASLGDLRY